MTSNLKKVAGAFSFAHLASKPAAAGDDDDDERKPKAAAADDDEDDERKKRDDETDEKYAERCKKMDEDAKAASDAPPVKDEDKDDEKAKAVRASGHSAGRAEERVRCAEIFASPAAAGNIALAAELAFNTEMPSAQVATVLGKAAVHAVAPGNPSRAARNPSVGIGAAANPGGPQAVASRWDRVLQSTAPKRCA